MKILKEFFIENSLRIALAQAIIATLGSLFFSEIMNYTPCVLCWYQRIAMYPLVIILAVGMYKKDKNISAYVLPLSIMGLFIALYHNLLYYHIISEDLQPCINGVSCTTKFFAWFGFVSIPLLSLIAFMVITASMFFYRSRRSTIKR